MGLIYERTMRFIDEHLRPAQEHIAQETVDELKDILSGPSPSAPGDPPGLDTGALQSGIRYEISSDTVKIISERDSGDPRVPGWLEHGTSRMDARPYFFDSQVHLDERIGRITKQEM